MAYSNAASRRRFVAGCMCAACAHSVGAAQPSARNVRSLKEDAPDQKPPAHGSPAPQGKKNMEIAFCGIFCAACELHLKGNKDGKKCKGCTHPSMESKCAVFLCAKEKKVVNCGLCDSFESCEKLIKHHEKPLYRQVARRTCARVKKDGLAAAAAELKTRWTCAACGKLFPWNTTGTCPHCGKQVAVLSEKDG